LLLANGRECYHSGLLFQANIAAMQRVRSLLAPRATLLCVLLLMALPLVMFWQVTLGPYTLIPADIPFQYAPFKASAVQLGVTQIQNPLLADLILENYQWKRFILDSLKGGELPLWNPHLFAGVPFLAAGQHSALYPLSIIYYALPLEKAYGWFTVVNLGLAGVFMFAFMRTLGLGRASSVFAGIIYQLSGMMLAQVVFQMIIAATAWLPLILAMCERIIQQSPGLGGRPSSLPWAVIGAVAIACHILAGHVEMVVYTAIIAALYSGWRIGTVIGFRYLKVDGPFIAKCVGWLLVMGLAGVALAAVQIVPLFELVTRNFREGRSSLSEVMGYGFPYRDIFRWVVPNIFGSHAHHSYFDLFSLTFKDLAAPQGHAWWGIKDDAEGGVYVGLLTLLFAGVGLVAHLRGLSKIEAPAGFFGLLSLVSVLFIFGTIFYAVLFYGLPGINQLHSPFRWKYPLTLCLAALAALGFEWLLHRMRKQNAWEKMPDAPKAMRLLVIGYWLIGIAALVGVVVVRLGWGAFEGRLASVIGNNVKLSNAFATPQEFFSYEAGQVLIAVSMFLLSGLVVWLWLSQNQRLSRLARVGVLALVTADLCIAYAGFNPAVDASLLHHKPQALEFLINHSTTQPTQPFRITTYTPPGTTDKTLNANLAWSFGLQDIRGYDSIIPKQYMDYMRAIEPQNQTLYNRVQPIVNRKSLESPLLDLLGVKYVLSEVPIDPPVQGLTQVFEAEGVRVYENSRAMPRAYVMPSRSTFYRSNFSEAIQNIDPRNVVITSQEYEAETNPAFKPPEANPREFSPASITTYKNNEVWIDADVAEPSWLILNDSYFPGWRAFIRPRGAGDDQESEVPVLKVNGNFRAVQLTNLQSPIPNPQSPIPNPLTVRFKYSPLTFQLGAVASGITLAALVFLALIYGYRNWPRAQGKDNAIQRVAKNSLVLTAFNIGARLIDFGFALLMARLLGPAGVGKYYFAVVIIGWFEIVMNFGLNTYLTREISRDPQHQGSYLRQTSLLRLMLGIGVAPLVALVVAAYSLSGNMDAETAWAVGLLAISQLPSSFASGLSALFFAHEKAEIPASMSIVSALIKVVIGGALLLLGYGVIGLAITSIVVNVIVLGILFVLSRRMFNWQLVNVQPSQSPMTNSQSMLRESFPLMLNHLLATLFFKVDVPLLKALRGKEGDLVVGWYSTAYKFVDAFNIIPAFFTQSLFPAMARQAGQSDNTLARTYVLAVKLLVMIAMPLAVATTYLAGWMIGLFGPEFLPEGQIALMMMIWSIPVGWINSVTNYALIAANQQRALTRAFVIGLVFNVIANLLLIPLFSYQAAALITIASEIVEGSAFYFYVRRHIASVSWVGVLARPALAAGVMALVAYPFAAGGLVLLLVGLGMGIAAYLVVLLISRVLDGDEAALLRPLLPGRLTSRLSRP
jgi:O-antigen/teichoic acid export membrane protein